MARRPTVKASRPPTVEAVLDAAERLTQTAGFNAFSYADVAASVGVSKATIHHHFPTKALLGECLIGRYAARFNERLGDIATRISSPIERLRSYVMLYMQTFRSGRLCLCGILSAELSTLSNAMQMLVRNFFDENVKWLAKHLEEARSRGQLHFEGSVTALGRLVIAGLQGLMLVARAGTDAPDLEHDAVVLVSRLCGVSLV